MQIEMNRMLEAETVNDGTVLDDDQMDQMLQTSVYATGTIERLARRHEYHDAEDLLQEAAIRMWRAEKRRHIDHPNAYANRTIRDCAIDRHRRKQRRIIVVGDGALHRAKAPLPSDWPLIDESIDTLPPAERDTVRLMLTGMSYADIAAKSNMQRTTVRKRASRARKRISAFLRD